MINTLDSNRLLNLKARYGIAINNGGSTNIYLSSKKLERELIEKLKNHFQTTMDLNIYIEKILSKVNDVDLCSVLLDWVKSNDSDTIIKETDKIKSFIALMRKNAAKINKLESDIENELIIDF